MSDESTTIPPQQQKGLKQKVVDFLNTFIKKRPSQDELRERNILVAPPNVSPRIQPSRYDLEKNMKGPSPSSSSSSSSSSTTSTTTTTNSKTHQRNNSNSRGGKSLGGGGGGSGGGFKKTVLEYFDFTFSRQVIGKTVVHRLKFPQFGLTPDELQEMYPDQQNGIPLVLTKGMEFLTKYLETEGLFRVNGSNKDISMLKFRVEDGDLNFQDVTNPYSICGLVSTFFKELPEPLIPCENYTFAIESVKLSNPEQIVIRLRELVLMIPPSHLCILRKFMEFLTLIEGYKTVNKMTSDNLGIIFGPTLMRDPDFTDITSGLMNLKYQSLCIKYMVEYFNDIFKSREVQAAYRKSMVITPPVDVSSIEYLDPATDDKKTRSSINSHGVRRPQPPPRRSGTMGALGYHTLGDNPQRTSKIYAVTTLTRPSRPPPTPRQITNTINNNNNNNNNSGGGGSSSGGAGGTTGRTVPSPPTMVGSSSVAPPSPVLSKRPAKPLPPKRILENYNTIGSTSSPSLSSSPSNNNRSNTMFSTPSPPLYNKPSNTFDKPPNKPPPTPNELKYKTAPSTSGPPPLKKVGFVTIDEKEKEKEKETNNNVAGPGILKKVGFIEPTNKISTIPSPPPPLLPRSQSFGASKPIPAPRSTTNTKAIPDKPIPAIPKLPSTPSNTTLNTINPNNKPTVLPKFPPTTTTNTTPSTTDPEAAKILFTTQRTSKSAVNLVELSKSSSNNNNNNNNNNNSSSHSEIFRKGTAVGQNNTTSAAAVDFKSPLAAPLRVPRSQSPDVNSSTTTNPPPPTNLIKPSFKR